jgi:hypothetical protein
MAAEIGSTAKNALILLYNCIRSQFFQRIVGKHLLLQYVILLTSILQGIYEFDMGHGHRGGTEM